MTNKRAGSIVVYKIKENVLYHGEKKKMIVGQTTMMKLHSKAKHQPKKYTNTREEDQCNVEKVSELQLQQRVQNLDTVNFDMPR